MQEGSKTGFQILLSQVLRQRRMERGALSLASPEVKFQIDTETHDPLDVGMYLVGVSLSLNPTGWNAANCFLHKAARTLPMRGSQSV